MSEHRDKVEHQALRLDAEEWAKGVKQIHVHSLTTMHYETNASRKDFKNGSVIDTEYYDGRIVRTQGGKVIRTFGKKLTGEALVSEYERHASNGSAWRRLHDSH